MLLPISLLPVSQLIFLTDVGECGPYYSHLGSAPTLALLRARMENLSGFRPDQVRMEEAVYCEREGKSAQGCPVAKYVSGFLYFCMRI